MRWWQNIMCQAGKQTAPVPHTHIHVIVFRLQIAVTPPHQQPETDTGSVVHIDECGTVMVGRRTDRRTHRVKQRVEQRTVSYCCWGGPCVAAVPTHLACWA